MANIWRVMSPLHSRFGSCRHTDGLSRYLIGILNSYRGLGQRLVAQSSVHALWERQLGNRISDIHDICGFELVGSI